MTLDDKTREQTALFRYGLIADLVHRPPAEKGLYPLLREKAERVYEIPGSLRTRVAADTIRDWLSAYRRGGFDALRPQVRRDQGRARAIPQEEYYKTEDDTSFGGDLIYAGAHGRPIPK